MNMSYHSFAILPYDKGIKESVMKQFSSFLCIAITLILLSIVVGPAVQAQGSGTRGRRSSSSVYVRPYVTKNGTYVEGYYRTYPNSTRLDNWSTKGNVNSFTGQSGTKDPYSSLYKPYTSYKPYKDSPYEPYKPYKPYTSEKPYKSYNSYSADSPYKPYSSYKSYPSYKPYKPYNPYAL